MPSRFCIGLTAWLALSLSAAANGAITGTSLGSSPPPAVLGGCALTPFPLDPQPAGGAAVASVASPLGGVVGFSPGTDHRRVGADWATWCHGYTGDVYFGAGLTSMTLTMPPATTGFVFYAVPNPFATFTFTVIGTTQSGLTAMVQADASGLNGCAGFAFSTDDPCDPLVTIVITRLADFAVGEFSICSQVCPGKGGECVVVAGQCCFGRPSDPAYSSFAGPIAVMTASPDLFGVGGTKVVKVFDLSGTCTAPHDVPFAAPSYSDPDWDVANLGSVFGVTLDAAGNIYVASTTCYNSDVIGSCGSAGGIYKISGSTGAISCFASLPNTGEGLGNIVYDCACDQFFVTNMHDGKIYRLDSAGATLSTFDHGAPYVPGTPGYAPLGERLWGVTVHDGRVYYGVWNENYLIPSATTANEVWSVGLDPDSCDFQGVAQLELTMPPLTGEIYSNPISDLRFTPSGTMLVAERTMGDGTQPFAHQSRLLEFVCTPGGWILSPNTFSVGHPCATLCGASTAGGVDVDSVSTCGLYWATGDALHLNNPSYPLDPDNIYGMQGLPPSGGSITNSVLIDYNGDITSDADKTQMGDVAISCEPAVAPCLNVSHEKVLCQLSSTDPPVVTGCFTYTFDITNKTDQPVKYVTLPAAAISPAGVTISPNVINLLLQDGSLLDPGESTTITLTICGGHSGDEVCFHISLQTPLFEVCCFSVLCVDLPPCDCGQLSRQEFSNVVCNPDGTVNFTFEFNLENLSTFLVTDVFLIPFNDEDAVIVPDYVAVVLPPGGSVHLTVQIMGAHPGEEFCFFVVSKHFGKEGKECCCAIQKCITVPECPKEQPLGCCDHPGAPCSMTTQADCLGFWNPNAVCTGGICITTVELLGCCTHPDGTCSTTTLAGCDGTWNPGATCIVPGGCVLIMPVTGDLNGDGVVDSLDLGILLASWTLSPKDSPCGGDRPCPVDLNQDGAVNSIDLGILLASWTM